MEIQAPKRARQEERRGRTYQNGLFVHLQDLQRRDLTLDEGDPDNKDKLNGKVIMICTDRDEINVQQLRREQEKISWVIFLLASIEQIVHNS